MVSKKILISGLAIASLGLTGCSGLQDMINNKIASTAKEVSDGINSEVGKATDALKAEGEKIEKDVSNALKQEVTLESMKNTEFYKLFAKYEKTPYAKFNNKTLGENNLTEVANVTISECTPNADGVCSYSFTIGATEKEWSKKTGNQTFYIMTTAGGPGSFYGPFTGDLQKLSAELKLVSSVKTVK